jgi:hypothetical protein
MQNERNWLIGYFQRVADAQHVRITFLSGDVHCAAVSVLKTLVKGKSKDVDPALDMRYMLNVRLPRRVFSKLDLSLDLHDRS